MYQNCKRGSNQDGFSVQTQSFADYFMEPNNWKIVLIPGISQQPQIKYSNESLPYHAFLKAEVERTIYFTNFVTL